MRLLATVAHPDDEAFGLGSLLAHAAAGRVESVVACATRGELGEPAPGSGVQGDVDPVELDPPPGSLAAAHLDVVAQRVATLIDDVHPDIVVTIGLHDLHRDHVAIGPATLAAVDRAAHRVARVYVWCLERELLRRFIGGPKLDVGLPRGEATTVVDVSTHLGLRWQAIRAHASQVPPFDTMSPDLADQFLRTGWLVRVRPPLGGWGGGGRLADDQPVASAASGNVCDGRSVPLTRR